MTDAQLLKDAAAAAGLTTAYFDYVRDCMVYPYRSELTVSHLWNPLRDDGDALRLAVYFRMMVHEIRTGYRAGYIAAISEAGGFYEHAMPDRFAATRRAIVRAAAALANKEH